MKALAILLVVLLLGCARQVVEQRSYPRAIRTINDQIARFNADRQPSMGISPIEQRASRIEKAPDGKSLICYDQAGTPSLTLKPDPGGVYVGEIRTPFHELPSPEGHRWGEAILRVQVASELLPP